VGQRGKKVRVIPLKKLVDSEKNRRGVGPFYNVNWEEEDFAEAGWPRGGHNRLGICLKSGWGKGVGLKQKGHGRRFCRWLGSPMSDEKGGGGGEQERRCLPTFGGQNSFVELKANWKSAW